MSVEQINKLISVVDVLYSPLKKSKKICRMLPDIAFNTFNVGRGGEIRTPDPLLPKQMRYQAALRPEHKNLYVINFQKQVNV